MGLRVSFTRFPDEVMLVTFSRVRKRVSNRGSDRYKGAGDRVPFSRGGAVGNG